MSLKSIGLSDEVHAYLVAHSPTARGSGPDPLVAELVARTHAVLPERASMQVSIEQAAFLTFLARLVGARYAVEVGTFTGLSALSIARGLAPGGHLLCCDVSTEFTTMAREFWQRAGMAERIELRIAPAAQTLADLPSQPHIDLAFIDADKQGYPTYWAELVPRMRPGGVIAVDNVLSGGRVVDPDAAADPTTAAVVEFNNLVLADDRVDSVMLPLADGVTLARRRGDL